MSKETDYVKAVGPDGFVRSTSATDSPFHEQGKSEPRPPPGSTVGEILDNSEERRRVLSETLPPPSRIFSAADTYSTAAAKIFLEAAIRTALSIERMLPAGTVLNEIPPRALTIISFQADAHRRTMRDAYLTAAVEMLKMIGGDFEPEPWLYGEDPSAVESKSSKLRSEEERICDLYHELTEPPPKKG